MIKVWMANFFDAAKPQHQVMILMPTSARRSRSRRPACALELRAPEAPVILDFTWFLYVFICCLIGKSMEINGNQRKSMEINPFTHRIMIYSDDYGPAIQLRSAEWSSAAGTEVGSGATWSGVCSDLRGNRARCFNGCQNANFHHDVCWCMLIYGDLGWFSNIYADLWWCVADFWWCVMSFWWFTMVTIT